MITNSIRYRDIEWVDHPTMNPRNTEQLRKLIEVRHVRCMWGPKDRHIITPRLCSEMWGDGRQLIALFPIRFRPNHFVVRIDSGITDTNGDEFRDLLHEKIYGSIQDEYYEWPWAKQYGLKWHENDGEEHDSRIDWSDGSAWGREKWPRLKRRIRGAK